MIKRDQAVIIEQEIKALSDEALFDEWRELFTRFRRDGKLPNSDRDRFFSSVKNWLREECLRRP